MRRSILDPKFVYVNAASTDVGRHLREWKIQQRAQAKEQKAQTNVVKIKKGVTK